MSQTLYIYLGDVYRIGDISWVQLETATWAFFNTQVKKGAATFTQSDAIRKQRGVNKVVVKHATRKPNLQKHDILVYIVPNSITGVLVHEFGSIEKEPMQFGAAAKKGNLYGAEVYVRRALPGSLQQIDLTSKPWELAKLIWHEAAHVKFGLKNDLHGRGGLARATIQFGSEDHPRGTWITPRNASDMNSWIDTKRTMWTGGFDVKIKKGPITV